MNLSKTQQLLSHAVLGFCLLLSFIYGLKIMFVAEYVEPCSTRYGTMMSFPQLETTADNSKRVINNDELAAIFGLSSWGVNENARVQNAEGLGNRSVIEVRFPNGSYGPRAKKPLKGGISYRWRHGRPEPMTAACLSYGLFLPGNFTFHSGGKLPGLFGRARPAAEAASTQTESFASRIGFSPTGVAGMVSLQPQSPTSGPLAFKSGNWVLPTGRWLKIDQEVVFNKLGESDGIVRVWVDGDMLVDDRTIQFRKSQDLHIDGVMGDLYYDGEDNLPLQGETTARITPFELRWN